MAAKITKYDKPILLSSMSDFVISGLTPGTTYTVYLGGADNEKSVIDREILNASLTADSSGKITITDMFGLLKDYFSSKGTLCVDVECSCEIISPDTGSETDAYSFTVFYGDTEVSDFTKFAEQCFLSLYKSKRTSKGRKEVLSLLSSTELATATVRAYYTDGSYEDKTVNLSEDEAKRDYIFKIVDETEDPYVCGWWYDVEVSPSLFEKDGKTLYRYVVKCGNRTMEYILDPEHEDADTVFMYKNSFGAWDLFYCNGKTETEDTFEREGAYVNGIYRNYKVTEVKNFNCDTGVLMPFETDMAQDLLRSDEVYMCKIVNGIYTKWKEVAITDNDASHTDNPSDLTRYTFTCRLAQKRQNVIDWHQFPEIFTKLYTSTYE